MLFPHWCLCDVQRQPLQPRRAAAAGLRHPCPAPLREGGDLAFLMGVAAAARAAAPGALLLLTAAAGALPAEGGPAPAKPLAGCFLVAGPPGVPAGAGSRLCSGARLADV